MIKFFRTIRKDLMEKNKTGKYLKYAIGEIILVVIGILIALQINNWNERRKASIVEIEILKEIKSSLQKDLDNLNSNSRTQNSILMSQNLILDWLEKDFEYHDSLANHFSQLINLTIFRPKASTFESLKQMGFRTITNDSLRNQILNLYENEYNFHSTIYNSLNEAINSLEDLNYIFFKAEGYRGRKLIPLNENKLKSNHEYEFKLRKLRDLNSGYIDYFTPRLTKEIMLTMRAIVDFLK